MARGKPKARKKAARTKAAQRKSVLIGTHMVPEGIAHMLRPERARAVIEAVHSFISRDEGHSHPRRAEQAWLGDRLAQLSGLPSVLDYASLVVEQICRVFDDEWRVTVSAQTRDLLALHPDGDHFRIPKGEVLAGTHIKLAVEHMIALYRTMIALYRGPLNLEKA